MHLKHSSFCSFKLTMGWSGDQRSIIRRDLMHQTATKSIQPKIHGPQRTDILEALSLYCRVELLCWSKTLAKLKSQRQTSFIGIFYFLFVIFQNSFVVYLMLFICRF